MKKISKFLAVLLALVMMTSTVALFASAASNHVAGIKFTYKDTSGNVISSVNQGDVVDLFVSLKTDGTNYCRGFTIRFFYDVGVFTQVRRNATVTGQSVSNNNVAEWLGEFKNTGTIPLTEGPLFEFDDANDALGECYAVGAADKQFSIHADGMYPSTWTDEQKAQYKGSQIYWVADVSKQQVMLDTGNTWCDVARFRFIANEAAKLTDKTVVADTTDAAAAPWVTYDVDNVPFANFMRSAGDILRASTPGVISIEYDLPAAETSIIKPMSSQIRFKGVKTEADFAAVYDKLPVEEKTFDVRTRVMISPEDFLATFGTDDDAKKAITDFGFVFATEQNVPKFDDAIAEKVAMGTATAEEAAGYKKQPCHYMQHVEGGDYMFTCLVKGVKDAEHTQVLNALAYIRYNGEYIFLDTHITADYATLYSVKPVA